MTLRLSLAAALLLGLACSKKPTPDYENVPDRHVVADGGTYVDCTGGEASKLNPVVASDSASSDLCDLIFNGLVRYSPKLELEGDLAESWKFSDGGVKLVFKLRKGVKWHDGKPFSSKDVKFFWTAVMDPKTASPRKSNYDLVTGVDTPDEHTVVVRYAKPFAPALDSWALGVVPAHILEQEKDINAAAFNRSPIGTGPYKFKRWVDKQYVELEANPDYYEGKPHIARFVRRFVPEQSTQLLEVKAGHVDTMALTPDQYKLETEGSGFAKVARKFRFPALAAYTYLGFNLKREPFNDRRVRLALSHAIDRQSLIEGVLQGLGRPCSGPYSPLVPAYNQKVLPLDYDLKKSAQLLAEAGFKKNASGKLEKAGKPLAFKLITNQGNDSRKKIVLILQQQFEKLGVDVEVQIYEWSTFLSNYIDKREFDAYVMGWNTGLEPDQHSIWHSSQTGPNQFNLVGYANPEVDSLLERGRTTFEPAERTRIYRRMHAIIAQDQPYAFLYAPDSLSALSRKFEGLMITDAGYGWYWPTRWYIPASLQK